MTQSEKDFIQANMINFESVKLGFTRNIPHDVLAEYERLYRVYLDPHFALTYYCSSCVFDMIQRLSYYYEKLPVHPRFTEAFYTHDSVTIQTETGKSFTFPDDLATIQPEDIAVSELPKKRGRKPKA